MSLRSGNPPPYTVAGLLALSICLELAGCAMASTDITSFRDPDYSATTFRQVLVVANVANLQWRHAMESRLVQEFRSRRIRAMESLILFPPTRNLTDEEKIEILQHNGIDCYLMIGVGEAGTSTLYIPPTNSTTTTRGSVSVFGNTANYREKSTTTTNGGYTTSRPWAEFEASLFDVATGRKAWIANGFTGGNGFAGVTTVVNSFCGETAERLMTEGVLYVNPMANE